MPDEPIVLKVDVETDVNKLINMVDEALKQVSSDFITYINSELKNNLDMPSGPDNPQEREQKKEDDGKIEKTLGVVSNATDKIADAGINIIEGVFGLVEQIYERLKKSSPLLEAIERIFNLAWALFFMPLGNKLGEVLIPAVIQLMDDVMEIWDAFEGMTLGEMFAYAIEAGVKLLGEFLINIGETLKDEGGLIGAIGNMLYDLGAFLEDHGAQLLEMILRVAEWVLTHIRELIAAVIAFKVASIGLMITQILTTAASGGILGTGIGAGWATAIGGIAISAGAGAAVGAAAYNLMGFAEGGHVPATAGGRLAIVGEGGEGEWIIPDSKMGSIGGNTYTINNYMMSTDELDRHIREVISGEISASRLRSGY